MAPLLLELGHPPAVAAATAAYMNLFTSASNIVHYTQIPGRGRVGSGSGSGPRQSPIG